MRPALLIATGVVALLSAAVGLVVAGRFYLASARGGRPGHGAAPAAAGPSPPGPDDTTPDAPPLRLGSRR